MPASELSATSMVAWLPLVGLRFTGTGTFGRVKLARRRADDAFVALKVLRKEQLLRLKQVQHVLNERRLLAAVDHPNIVKM
jgi:protein kinase A